MELYHSRVLGECVGGHKVVCACGICAEKGNELRAMSYFRYVFACSLMNCEVVSYSLMTIESAQKANAGADLFQD
jgi:hypothetical protein